MASLGTFLLLSAFVTCSYAAVISVAGARRRSRRLIESGIGAFYLICAIMTAASAVLWNAFLTGDFSMKYVAHYSDSVQPLLYKITSYWGGLDGSIMFWVFLLSVFGSLAVYMNRERHRELIPYVVATISVVNMFFLFLMVIHKNPFTTFLTAAPAEGEGLNPLLQNAYMAIHPPSLYTGFVGMTIPFAFGIAALITGHLDDSWLRAVRRWTMFSWLFLSFGLILGMIWAYEELGWGGYWAWDPVENAALLPWFTATAFLHSVMVQERRSMLRVWNITLVIVTFFLTIFGTFMTRSGVVQSVHAFGDDPILARLFIGFMVVIVTFSFSLVIWRLPLLKSRNELDSWLSREAAFLVNNWVMLFAAFFVLFGTMFPTLSEAVTGNRITVAGAFFNKWMTPIGLVLLMLTGVGPLLAWRRSSLSNIGPQFIWPVVSGAAALGVAMGYYRIPVWPSGLCFALCGFVVGTIVQEFWKGAAIRSRNSGTDLFTALIGLVGKNKRRYGGYIVHVGIVLICFGFAGNARKLDEQVLLKPGQETRIGKYTIKSNGVKVADDGQKQMTTAYLTVFVGGKEIGGLYPAKWAYRRHEQEPTTEVAIRRTAAEDLYAVLGGFDLADQSATLQLVVNPLVNWIWFGFGIMALGTGIALLPERSFAFAVVKLPAEAAATTVALLAIILLSGGVTLSAQSMGGDNNTRTSFYARTPFEKEMQHEIVCTCGACGHQTIAECRKDPCGTSHEMRGVLASLIDSGVTDHDKIIQAFIAKYGSEEMLGAPVDRGFSRIAWLLPYVVGATSAFAVGIVAMKWSRKPDASAAAAAPLDSALEERIDDELRDLD
jgi:cytochrome c-type biogenesis protein CcmF